MYVLQGKQWNLGQHCVFHKKAVFFPKYKQYGYEYFIFHILNFDSHLNIDFKYIFFLLWLIQKQEL